MIVTVQYRKNYFQNRNRILGQNGVAWLGVPVLLKDHLQKKIYEIEIDNTQNWPRKYFETIRHNYKDHPYYQEHAPFFQDLCARQWTRLVELNEHIIRYVFAAFGVRTPIVRASELGGQGSSSELLLDLCRKTQATIYLAGQSAKGYLNEEIFHAQGIKVLHHHFVHPTYPQFKQTEFVSHLSAADLLFNCGPQGLGIIRSGTPQPFSLL
jgi:WbqC-like protein family